MRRCALQAEVYQALCRAGYPPDDPGRVTHLLGPDPPAADPDEHDTRQAEAERWSERCHDMDTRDCNGIGRTQGVPLYFP